MSGALDGFCGSPFWNASLTWNTEDPDFTLCFEKVVLVLLPVVVFWTFAPLEWVWFRQSLNRDIPWNWKNQAKFLIVGALSLITTCEFLSNLRDETRLVKVDVYMPVVKLASFICSGFLIYYNKKYGMQTSGHQFMFWFLCALCGAPQFRTELRGSQKGEQNELFHTTYLVYYPLVFLMFLLNIVADERPRVDVYEKVQNPCPIVHTSFLGRILYTYYDSLLYKGFRRPLRQEDMWKLEHQYQAQNIVPQFEGEFLRRVAKSKEALFQSGKATSSHPEAISVLPVIFRCFYPRFIVGVLCRLAVDLLIFVNPQILSLLIFFIESNDPIWKGILYACCMFAVGSLQTIMNNIHFQNLWLFALPTRTSLIACIYRKALRISNGARKHKTVGEIVNLMAADAERFQEFSISCPVIWSAPLQLCLAMYFLWQEVGIASLAALGVLILLVPINVVIVRRTKRLQIKQMQQKDERLRMMSEILNGIKVLKLYAWEESFQRIVEQIRLKEVSMLLKGAFLTAGSQFVWNCAPFFIAFVVFGTYVLIDENNVLNASKAFVSLALINLLKNPMNMIPGAFNLIVQTSVSLKRINSFLNAEELNPYVQHDPFEADPIAITNGFFSWGGDSVLKNINFRVSSNSITAIVGPVGCGKSSLISALLGEMDKQSGTVNSIGTVAYVSQQAWIQNATVRENILFGKPDDKVKYQRVIEACALRPDLDMLANGDMTEIGERGINLSGGQKQRISLARAVYEDADIYLLDDPLSAVDSHVGKHIFKNVISPEGMLAGKVRVLVTHAVTYLPKADKIYVMNSGEIQETGSYQELLAKKGPFAEFLLQHIANDSDEQDLEELEEQVEGLPLAAELKRTISRQRSRVSETSNHMESAYAKSSSALSLESARSSGKEKKSLADSLLVLQDKKFKRDKGKLIETERAEMGTVKLEVFKYYFVAIGFSAILGAFLFYMGFQGFGIGSSIWLGRWAEDTNIIVDGKVNTSLQTHYLWVYGALGLAQGFCIFAADVTFARGTTGAAAKLHNVLMGTVMRLPMAFFDVTPIGRIIARFSSDIIGVDLRLPNNFSNFMMIGLRLIGTIVVICYTTPLFTAVLVPVAVLYVFIQRYFVSTTRQVKRLESVSRSPIYSHFSETISGTAVIRAYRCQDRFVQESERNIDNNQQCTYPANFANRWLAIRLETIGNFIILMSALFAVLNKNLSASMVGLSVSYALQITQALNMLVRCVSDGETSIVSVERIKEYSEAEQENAWDIPAKRPVQEWPSKGQVEFRDYSVRYRPGLDLVLKKVNFCIQGGEKIGIVGRTGAGKSSLTLSLFRIIEATSGAILIDGINISELGLHDLRSKLTIIPQDAVLFSGTLRLNLDPFEAYSDAEVWKCVELAHLQGFVSGLSSGLYHQVSEGGINLSIGQRQLVCLARALLRKTKILVLDEATAAVDLDTDDLIQKTIRSEFWDCTIITIAHRLNTIIDSNRVLVLDGGRIAEFAAPGALLDDKKSLFYNMCKDAGLLS